MVGILWYLNITIRLSSNSGQSQVHFGIKFIFVGACVAK